MNGPLMYYMCFHEMEMLLMKSYPAQQEGYGKQHCGMPGPSPVDVLFLILLVLNFRIDVLNMISAFKGMVVPFMD